MSKNFWGKKRARFLATKDAFLAKNIAQKGKDLKEQSTIVIRKGWRAISKKHESLEK